MDEYIKKSEAVDVILKYPYDIAGKTATAIKMIEDLPSADVVPKSEYDAVVSAVDNSTKEFLKLHDEYQGANAEIERLKHILNCYALQYGTVMDKHIVIEKARAEVASEIFGEIDKIITDDLINRKLAERGLSYIVKNEEQNLEQRLAELKKKYTEGNDDRL